MDDGPSDSEMTATQDEIAGCPAVVFPRLC
jgi:hypothetical protein